MRIYENVLVVTGRCLLMYSVGLLVTWERKIDFSCKMEGGNVLKVTNEDKDFGINFALTTKHSR